MSHASDGYSAPVSMELHLENEVIGVHKVGPDRIVLCESRLVPVGAAKLVIKIGDSTQRTDIVLSNSNPIDGTVNYR